MNQFLKVKALSLGAEARIIRAEELRLAKRIARARAKAALVQDATLLQTMGKHIEGMDITRVGMHTHRVKQVRIEARATHLARGFLKGVPYRKMEWASWTQAPWHLVQRLIEKYRPGDVEPQVILQQFAEWRDAAGEWKLPRVGPRVKAPRVNKGAPMADLQ